MTDVRSLSALRDSCVVLPSLDHALWWWLEIKVMIDDAEPDCLHTKTAIIRRRSGTALRLWVPYEPEPTFPMDFIHDDVFRFDYLCLFGLVPKRAIKWAR
jgi:hypothetical protein